MTARELDDRAAKEVKGPLTHGRWWETKRYRRFARVFAAQMRTLHPREAQPEVALPEVDR